MSRVWDFLKRYDPNASFLDKKLVLPADPEAYAKPSRPSPDITPCNVTDPYKRLSPVGRTARCDLGRGHEGDHWASGEDRDDTNTGIYRRISWTQAAEHEHRGIDMTGVRRAAGNTIAFYDKSRTQVERESPIDPKFDERDAPWGEDMDYLSHLPEGSLVDIYEETPKPIEDEAYDRVLRQWFDTEDDYQSFINEMDAAPWVPCEAVCDGGGSRHHPVCELEKDHELPHSADGITWPHPLTSVCGHERPYSFPSGVLCELAPGHDVSHAGYWFGNEYWWTDEAQDCKAKRDDVHFGELVCEKLKGHSGQHTMKQYDMMGRNFINVHWLAQTFYTATEEPVEAPETVPAPNPPQRPKQCQMTHVFEHLDEPYQCTLRTHSPNTPHSWEAQDITPEPVQVSTELKRIADALEEIAKNTRKTIWTGGPK